MLFSGGESFLDDYLCEAAPLQARMLNNNLKMGFMRDL